MIVLDEQLQGLELEDAVARWYRGTVLVVRTLRPGTVIRDDAMPTLLRRLKQPTFVTINYRDFWRRVPGDRSYCIVCLALAIDQADKVSGWLRQLFRLPEFKTKAARVGKVVIASQRRLQYTPYTKGMCTSSDGRLEDDPCFGHQPHGCSGFGPHNPASAPVLGE